MLPIIARQHDTKDLLDTVIGGQNITRACRRGLERNRQHSLHNPSQYASGAVGKWATQSRSRTGDVNKDGNGFLLLVRAEILTG